MKKTPLLRVEKISKKFPVQRNIFGKPKQFIPAVDEVSFEVAENEILGIVGESGSGKSTLCRLLLHLIPPDSGKVYLLEKELSSFARKKDFRPLIQMVFQDPADALNPRFSLKELLEEPFVIHSIGNKKFRDKKTKYLADLVGLPKNSLQKYPHEFSGGQKQRIGIARALALSPKIIVADEPVSALDVSIQSQILNLFLDIQKEFKTSFILVSHDLNTVRLMSKNILILYLGKVAEYGDCKKIFESPQHPYTQVLIDSILRLHPHKKKKLSPIQGEIAHFLNLPSGCYFSPRCSYSDEKCRLQFPPLEKKKKNIFAACWNSHQLQKK